MESADQPAAAKAEAVEDWDGFSKRDIWERDSRACQMPHCLHPDGRAINPGLPYTDIWSASVDHILPRWAGGNEMSSNRRAAHRACNERAGRNAACHQRKIAVQRAILSYLALHPGASVHDLTGAAPGLTVEYVYARLDWMERKGLVLRAGRKPVRWHLSPLAQAGKGDE